MPKRPRDMNELAKQLVDEATGESLVRYSLTKRREA